jgi:hypothetical protein
MATLPQFQADGRGLSPERPPLGPISIAAPAALVSGTRRRLPVLTLVVGCVAAAALAGAVGAEGGARVAAADPELARLLRAMAAVKAVILVLAVGALGWRMSRPVDAPFLAAYLVLPWIGAAGLGAMWQLAAPGLTSLVLHGAGALLLLIAARDRDFLPARR